MTRNCNSITRSHCFNGKRHDFVKMGWYELKPSWYVKWCQRCGSILYQYKQGETLTDVINGFLVPWCVTRFKFTEEIENGRKEVSSNSR